MPYIFDHYNVSSIKNLFSRLGQQISRISLLKRFSIGFLIVCFFVLYNFVALYNSFGSETRTSLIHSYPSYNYILDSSPDGTANYRYARQFAEHSELYFTETLNTHLTMPLVAPRSVRVVDAQYQIPTSFIGIDVLYGTLAKLFGVSSMPYYSFFFTIFGLISFWYIIRFFFDTQLAYLTTFLAMFFPAFIYWQNRSLMHNVLFVDLFFIGMALLIYALHHKRAVYAVSAGIFLGLALIVRSAEVVIIAGSIGLFLTLYSGSWKTFFSYASIIFCCLLAMLSPVFLFNIKFYGAPLSVGYAADLGYSSLLTDIFTDGHVQKLFQLFKIFITPFGIHSASIITNIKYFILDMYGIYFWIFAVGFLVYCGYAMRTWYRTKTLYSIKKHLCYVFWWILVSALLILLYGSWELFDNTVKQITIGTSHTRYWLLMYLLSLPFVASVIRYIARISIAYTLLMIVLVIVLMGNSIHTVFFDKYDGLIPTVRAIDFGYAKVEAILTHTEPDAVIAQIGQDKNYVHVRRVMPSLDNTDVMKVAKEILDQGIPVYWHYFHFDNEQLHLFNQNMKSFGTQISEVADVHFGPKEALYKVELYGTTKS